MSAAVGRRYLLGDAVVTVRALGGGRWLARVPHPAPNHMVGTGLCQDARDPSQPSSSSPRNALVEYEDGRLVVRPFRGLRRV